MILPDWLYDIVKKLLTLILPALGTLVIGLAKVWNLDIPSQQINDSIILVCGFLCVVFNVNNHFYYKQEEITEETEDPEQ